jgi:hypothetical protein
MGDRVASAREPSNVDLEIHQFWVRFRFHDVFVDVVDFSCHLVQWLNGVKIN